MHQQYIIEPLDNKNHISKNFTCGVEELNIYLREKANQEVKKNTAAVYILRHEKSFAILGYFTLSSSSIMFTDLPETLAKKLPKYKTLPVILLGRLAVDTSSQGKNIGTYLLMESLHRSYTLSKQIGSFAVVVDTKNKKVSQFYEKFGFMQFLQNPLKLYLLMKTIKQLRME